MRTLVLSSLSLSLFLSPFLSLLLLFPSSAVIVPGIVTLSALVLERAEDTFIFFAPLERLLEPSFEDEDAAAAVGKMAAEREEDGKRRSAVKAGERKAVTSERNF